MSSSPLPQAVVKKVAFDFYEALKELNKGRKITRLEWKDNNIFGILKDGKVMIKTADGLIHPWTLSDGDLAGEDWILL
jgi:hypothetical protein